MIGYGTNGTNYDFFCFNASNQVWNGTTFVNWSDADYASYRVAATQQGTSGRFTAAAPTGTFRYEMRERGASLALSFVVWAEKGPRETWDLVSDSTTALSFDRT